MTTVSLLRSAFAAWCFSIAVGAHAEALIKPLPTPNAGKLSAVQAKDLDQARAEFDKAKVGLVGPALAQAYADIGALYFRNGLDETADVAFYDAAQLAPNDGRWPYLRGVIASGQKRTADARANYEAALALDQVYLPIRYRLADALIELGQLDGAHKLLEAAFAEYNNVAVLAAMLGRLELRQQRYAEAAAHLQAALKLEPQATALYKDLASVYNAQGNAQLAQETQAKAGAVQPELADPLIAGIFKGVGAAKQAPQGPPLEQARQLLADRHFEVARVKVGEVLKANADDIEALALAARLDAITGRRAEAQGEAARALKLDGGNASANLSQGMVYEFAGDEANAYTYYKRAVQSDGNQPDARLLLGNALMRRGDYAQAAEQYRHLVAIAPRNDSADARLAAALVAAGHCNDALSEINAALSKRSKDADLLQIFVRLASTCAAASAQERSMALDYANALYRDRPDAGRATALALALAAHGKFDEAQRSQAEAIFDASRAGDSARAQMYRETMRQFASKQVPDKPWPSAGIYFKPPLLTPIPGSEASH